MPAAFKEHLIARARPLPAGGHIPSYVIDVRDAQHIIVDVRINNKDRDVRRTIFFGRTTQNAWAPLRTDTFEHNSRLLTAVPVRGPELLVVVENQGTRAATCNGAVYVRHSKVSRKIKIISWVSGVLVGAILTTWISPARVLDQIRWHIMTPSFWGTPDCNDTSWLERVEARTVYAHYQEPSSQFGATQVIDNNPTTAWLEPWPAGPHVDAAGYDIAWRLPRERMVKLICVRNGWDRDHYTYQQHGRLKSMVIKAPGCKDTRPPDLPDYAAAKGADDFISYTSIKLSCQTDQITMKIVDIYKGGRGNPPFPDDVAWGNRETVGISDVKIYVSAWPGGFGYGESAATSSS